MKKYIKIIILGVLITTVGWIIVTLLTKPSETETINSFESLVFGDESKFKNINFKILAFLMGVIGTYSFLFATGYFIYGKTTVAIILSFVTIVCALGLIKIWKKIV